MTAWRTWLPHRIVGRVAVRTEGAWQLIGGRRWSLVLFTSMRGEQT